MSINDAHFPSQAAQNPIDADLFHNERQPAMQNTAPILGPDQAFIEKHVHPPRAVPSYDGMPTNDTRSQVVINWTKYGIINSSKYVPYGVAPQVTPVDPQQVSGYAILSTSGPNHPSYRYVKFDAGSGDTWALDINNCLPLDVYNVNRFPLDANLYRPAYKSTTIYLNATSFNDTGIVASAQFNPPLKFAGNLEQLASKDPKLFDQFVLFHAAQGVKTDFRPFNLEPKHLERLADLHDKALREFAIAEKDRLDKEFEHLSLGEKEEAKKNKKPPAETIELRLDPSFSIQVVDFGAQGNVISGLGSGSIVPTSDQVMNLSTRAYGGKALDGAFIVNRLNTISPEWKCIGPNRNATAFGKGLYYCYYTYENAAGDPLLGQFYASAGRTPISGTPGAFACEDAQWSMDQTWSWTVFEGLSPNLVAPSNAQRMLAIKDYMGFEVQAAAKSPWAGIQRLAPRPNMRAMEALLLAYYDMKDCTEAKYNFLGTLVSTIMKNKDVMEFAKGASLDVVGRGLKAIQGALNKKVEVDVEKSTPSGGVVRTQTFYNSSLRPQRSTSRRRSQSRPRARTPSRNRSASRGRSQSRTRRPASRSRPSRSRTRKRAPGHVLAPRVD